MRLVLRCHDARRARALRAPFEAAGLAPVTLAGPAALRAAPDSEDITLIDGADAEIAFEFAQKLRDAGAPSLAVVALRAAGEAPPRSAASPIDAWISLDAPTEGLRRRLNAIFREGVARAEVEARVLTAMTLGLTPPQTPVAQRPPAIMFVGAPAPVYLSLESALKRLDVGTRAALSSYAAFDHLDFDDFDALMLNAAEDPAAALSMAAAVRRNGRLHDMKVFLLGADDETTSEALARGADEALPSKFDADVAAAWMAEDIARARRARGAEQALADMMDGEAQTFSFLGFHLAGQAQTHHDCGRPLSVAIVEVAGGEHLDAEAWRKGFSEFVTLCWHTVRAPDGKAVIDARRILLCFPCTDAAGAQSAVDRVVAVCQCTAFAAGDRSGAPLSFSTRVAELSPGESGAGLLARMLSRSAA